MFVSFFSFVMFTSMSSEREFSPTIWPSYTSEVGWTKNEPRSCRLIIANGVTTPARSATSEPAVRNSMGPAHGAVPAEIEFAMPVPRVSVMKRVRKPMRPRAGTLNSMRTQPVPWFAIVSIVPLRDAMSCVIAPRCSSGTSIVMCSSGSWRTPSTCRVTTCGLPTVSSKPSRRICSTRIASASSPRPCTSHASGRSVGSTLSDTLPTSSWSRRSFTWRAVTFVPFSRPASGEVLMPIVMEIAGSSTVMPGMGRGSSRSVIVSPMLISGMPAIATMSPADASVAGMRSSTRVSSSSVTFAEEISPFECTHATCWPLRSVPP